MREDTNSYKAVIDWLLVQRTNAWPLRDLQDLDYFVCGDLRKFRRARVGHRFWEVEDRLFFVIERRRSDERDCFVLL